MVRAVGLLWTLAALAFSPVRVTAQTIYAVDNTNDRLVRVDKDTGTATLSTTLDTYIGGFGAEFDPTGTTLYVVAAMRCIRSILRTA